MHEMREAARASKAWPFEEARRVIRRFRDSSTPKDELVFQTGYGPSGLPHIGTFGEVARTSMVRHAFGQLSDIPTRLVCFSDDMDGFRKVPGNVPMQEELRQNLHLPLTKVRDPFGRHKSFAHHNNARLREFLDGFGFDYEFISSTEYYTTGRFDGILLTALERFDRILEIMLPTLGTERRETYSCFLPISPKTGHVLQVPTLERNLSRGTIIYREPDGEKVELPVTGGNVKMQWKPDWAMRWVALGVDYEMSGKDLIESVAQSSRICRALGGLPPETLSYELFNDELGQKISKSKGNGLSMEEWLAYATPESLSYFMYQKPKTAKRLHFDVIPKSVDEYHRLLQAFPKQGIKERLGNPVWHVHDGAPPESSLIVPFSMLLNLAAASGAENTDLLWGFIRRQAPKVSPRTHPDLDRAAEFAVRYFQDRVKPSRQFRAPTELERQALAELRAGLEKASGDNIPPDDSASLEELVYAAGRDRFHPLRDWFRALYEVLLGTSQGPRFSGFISLYGIKESVALIDRALNGELVQNSSATPDLAKPEH